MTTTLLAHHWFFQPRGGERVLAELAAIVPAAPILTAFAADDVSAWPAAIGTLRDRVRTSRLQPLFRLATRVPAVMPALLPLLPWGMRNSVHHDWAGAERVVVSDAGLAKKKTAFNDPSKSAPRKKAQERLAAEKKAAGGRWSHAEPRAQPDFGAEARTARTRAAAAARARAAAGEPTLTPIAAGHRRAGHAPQGDVHDAQRDGAHAPSRAQSAQVDAFRRCACAPLPTRSPLITPPPLRSPKAVGRWP